MKLRFALALTLALFAVSAFAADDGNTKPRLNEGSLFSSGTIDVPNTTSGAGNVKGIRCTASNNLTVSVYVNGGTAQTFTITSSFPNSGDTQWIPMNIRFSSSIRVNVSSFSGDNSYCWVSWALD